MANRLSIAIACGLFCASIAAHANDAITDMNNEVGFSVGGHNTDYHELAAPGQHVDSDGYIDSEIGTQRVYSVAISRQGSLFGMEQIYTSATAAVSHGTTEYIGQTQGGNSYDFQHPSTTFDAELKIGKAFPIGAAVQVTPYLAYGYHRWIRDGIGFKEVYSQQEAGPGVLAQYAPISRLVLGLDLHAGYTFDARMVGSSGFAGEPGITPRLGSRPTETAAVSADYALTRHIHLTANYTVQHFEYGASPLVVGWYESIHTNWMEPASKTTAQIFTAGVSYSF